MTYIHTYMSVSNFVTAVIPAWTQNIHTPKINRKTDRIDEHYGRLVLNIYRLQGVNAVFVSLCTCLKLLPAHYSHCNMILTLHHVDCYYFKQTKYLV